MTPLIDATLLPALARLTLVAPRRSDGLPTGNRTGRRRGLSLDFADHRAYADGDDLRFLDWQVLARHDQPYIRRYYEEQALPLRLLLDTSASMGHGEPAKLDFARRLAAHLAFIGLAGGAAVSVHPFADQPTRSLGPVRGRNRLRSVVDRLLETTASGGSDLAAACRQVTGGKRAGLTVVLSDFLIARGRDEALMRLHHARHGIFLLRVASPDELEPRLGGDLTLVDSETGDEMSWSLTPSLVELYKTRLVEFAAALDREARRRNAGTAHLRTDAPLGELLLAELPQRGLLR